VDLISLGARVWFFDVSSLAELKVFREMHARMVGWGNDIYMVCRYCESEVEKFCTSGDFNLICEDSCHQHSSGHVGHIRKSRSSASSLSGGDSPSHHHKPRRTQSMMEKDFRPKTSHSMTEDEIKAALLSASQAHYS
jgi:hypothetical protein